MKTTAKLSLLAAAFLLMIAGCANNFTPTEPSKDSFAKNVENKNAQTSKPLTVTALGFSTPQKYSNGSDYLVTLTFSHPVDLSSIKNAVTFYKLKGNIPTTEKAQKEDTKIVFDVLDDVNSKNVSQVHFKLKDVDKVKVYAYVTGSAVKAAVTDQKMDQDKDKEQGEPVDDDYGDILNVGTVTGDYGNTDYLNMGASNTKISKTLPFSISSISFETARKADNFGKEADPEGGTLVTHITVGNTKTGDKYASETSYGIKYSDFESLLKNHVIVEQVGTKDGTGWEKVDTSFSYVSEDGHPYKGKFVSAITVKPETMLRVRFKDIQKIAVPSGYYEYQLKYTTNAHASDALAMKTSNLLLEKDNSGKKVMFSATLPASNLKAEKVTGTQTFTLTYTVPSKFENAVFANKAARDVKLMTKDGYIIGEYKGFDTSTLKKENFKLIGNNISGTAVNTYTAKRAYSAKGITATLSVRKSGSASGGTAVLRDITALGNSTERSSSEKYYADVTNTVTFAYDVVYTNNGAMPAEGFYGDLNNLYNLAKSDTTTVYKNNDLTKKFFTTVQSKNMLISEQDILSFIHGAVGDVLGKGKDDFVANGQVTTGIPKVQSPLYLYLSPAVKTHSFKGMYNNGTEDVINYPIPAFSFAKVQPTSKDKLEREDGWLRLAVN